MDQITYVIHQLHYNIYLVYKFQPAIMNEWKDIREQTSDKDVMRSFWKEFPDLLQFVSLWTKLHM